MNDFDCGIVTDIMRMNVRIDLPDTYLNPVNCELDPRTADGHDVSDVLQKIADYRNEQCGGNLDARDCDSCATLALRKKQLMFQEIKVTVALATYDHNWVYVSAPLLYVSSWKFLIRNLFNQMKDASGK